MPAESHSPEGPVMVGETPTHVWVRVSGKGSFLLSPAIKKFSDHHIAKEKFSFIFDLSRCTGMDSTFMGTMTGIALHVLPRGGQLQVVGAGERIRASLENLGLDQVIIIHSAQPNEIPELQSPAHRLGSESKSETARIMLDAHQALIEVQPGNFSMFRDVLDYLEKEVEDSGTGGISPPRGS